MRALRSTPWQLAAVYLLALVPPMIVGTPGGLAAMAAMTIFAVANPVTVAMGESWWVSTVLSAVGFLVLFAAVGTTPGVRAMREDGMVFMLPAMVYLAAVPLSALIRAWRWRSRRAAAPTA